MMDDVVPRLNELESDFDELLRQFYAMLSVTNCLHRGDFLGSQEAEQKLFCGFAMNVSNQLNLVLNNIEAIKDHVRTDPVEFPCVAASVVEATHAYIFSACAWTSLIDCREMSLQSITIDDWLETFRANFECQYDRRPWLIEPLDHLDEIKAYYKVALSSARRRAQQAAVSQSVTKVESPSTSDGDNAPLSPTANSRMIDILSRKPESKNWTARQWATELGCSPSTIHGTEAWKAIMTTRGDAESDLSDRQSFRDQNGVRQARTE